MANKTYEKQTLGKAKPIKLVNGEVCYTVPVRYTNTIYEELREIKYKKRFNHLSEAIFYCIDNHEKNNLLSSVIPESKKESCTALTIRFRKNHYDYICNVCEEKGLKTFASGVRCVIQEYLEFEKRL